MLTVVTGPSRGYRNRTSVELDLQTAPVRALLITHNVAQSTCLDCSMRQSAHVLWTPASNTSIISKPCHLCASGPQPAHPQPTQMCTPFSDRVLTTRAIVGLARLIASVM